FLQHGMLPRYLLTLVGTVALIVMTIFVADPPQWAWPQSGGLTVPVLGASLLIALGAAAAVLVKDHLVLLLVGGLVGYGSAVAFLFLGAPDVAFTQFVVETIFVVVVATLLLRLRRMGSRVRRAPQDPSLRIVPLFVSVVFSIALTVPLFLASGLPLDSALTDFYAAQSLPAGHGRNVVNIILVDFRALDTLGEIAVITFSLLAAVPLLSRIRRKRT
ncbi:MAG: hydrogen gas-evolving membrane-bound hydrogenase subunit E, partial [bacterium]|nr:hydrogen gas-evolving membrane-bound hydrogenase subunit E [bacterium]